MKLCVCTFCYHIETKNSMYFNRLKTDIHLYRTTNFSLYLREKNTSTLQRPITDSLHKIDVSEARSTSVFRPGVRLTSSYSVTCYHRNTQLVKICAWEQIKSAGSNKKIATEKLKTTAMIHKLKPQKRAMKSDSSGHRYNIKNQNSRV